MKRKKLTPVKKEEKPVLGEDNTNALEDTHIYRAGHEVDESFSTPDEDDIAGHTNGGLPDVVEEDDDDSEDNDEDDDRA